MSLWETELRMSRANECGQEARDMPSNNCGPEGNVPLWCEINFT